MSKIQFSKSILALALVLSVVSFQLRGAEGGNSGPNDTTITPVKQWQVRDENRPQPEIVAPGQTFSHMAPPPSDATVLFDGTDLSHWERGRGQEPRWRVEDGYMENFRGAGSIHTKERFEDFQLHLEFATPSEVLGNGQGRGNSGVLINGMYEVQVLDSYGNTTYPDGQAGAIYGQTPPLVNASKPPGTWQTYDIIFESPRWNEDGELVKKGNVTVIHNGVVLHHKWELLAGNVQKHEPAVFIELQDHNNPVRYRNIWIRELGGYDETK